MAAAGGSYAPVSKESLADDDADNDDAALTPRQREQSDAETPRDGGGGDRAASGCDCLTALLAKLRDGCVNSPPPSPPPPQSASSFWFFF